MPGTVAYRIRLRCARLQSHELDDRHDTTCPAGGHDGVTARLSTELLLLVALIASPDGAGSSTDMAGSDEHGSEAESDLAETTLVLSANGGSG